MGQYLGKYPWYLEYHVEKSIRTFASLNSRVSANLLKRTRVYFLNIQLYHSYASELPCIFQSGLSHL